MKAMLETERSETSQQKCRAVWEMYILYMEYIYIYLLSVDWYQTVTAVPGAKCQRTVDSGVIFSSKCGAKNPQNHWVTYGLRHTGMAPIRTPKIGFYQESMGRLGRGRMSSNTSPPGDQHQWCQAAAQSHLCGSAWKASLWPLQKKREKIEEDFAYVIQVGRYPRWIVMWRSEICVFFASAAQTSQTNWGAAELLNITVGTQSISPLYWAIESGSLNTAKAMLEEPWNSDGNGWEGKTKVYLQ